MEVNREFGRIEKYDGRDSLFPVSAILPERDFVKEKYWWADGWWGDQKSTSQCVAYSWIHWLEDGPVVQDGIENRIKPFYDPAKLYKEAQKRDEVKGTNYNGSTVRAGAKILKELNIIKEYRWAFNINDIERALLNIGPVVVGTKWYKDMYKPSPEGFVKLSGGDAGGHAYLLNGVDTDKGIIRFKNSWGRKWGVNGHGYITYADMKTLLERGGDACIAIEAKLTTQPLLENLIPFED
jgi:C1A family cysteine protease